MSGWVDYSCSNDLKHEIPSLFNKEGIKVVARPLPKGFAPDEGFKFGCSRGFGRVESCGTHADEPGKVLFAITTDHSLFWFWSWRGDMLLLKEVEQLLLDHGAVCNNPVKKDDLKS